MSDSTVEIRITGKLDPSLKASTDQAVKSMGQLNLSNEQGRALYNQFGGDLKKYAASLQGATSAAGQAGGAAEQVSAKMAETTAAMKAAGAATEGMTISTSRLSRSSMVLAHALVTGQYNRIPGELMVAGEAFGGLNLAMLGTIGAAAAMTAGLGYLIHETIEAEHETTRLAAAFALTGRGAEANRGFISAQIDLLKKTADISESGAQKLLAWEAADGRFSATFINSANQIYGVIKEAFGDKAETVFKNLVGEIAGLTDKSLPELNQRFLNLTPAQYEVVDGMLRIGNVTGAQQQLFHDLAERGGKSISDIQAEIKKLEDQAIELTATMTVMSHSARDGAAIAAAQIAAEVSKIQDQIRGLRQTEQKKQVGEDNHDQTTAIAAARAINAEYDKRAPILANLKQLTDALNRAQAGGDTQAVSALSEAIGHEQKKLTDLQTSDNEKVYRDFVAKEEAKAAAFKTGSAERIQIGREELAKAAQLFGTESQEYQRALAKMRSDQRAAADHQTQIQREADQKWLQGIEQTATQVEQVLQRGVDGDNQRSRAALTGKKRDLDQQVAARQLSANEEMQILVGLYGDEAQLEIDALKAHQQANADNVQVYDEDAQKILNIYRRLFNDIDNLQHDSVKKQEREIDRLTHEYEKRFRPITSNFNSMIREMTSGQMTFGQAVRQSLGQMLDDAIQNDLRRLEHWIFAEVAKAEATKVSNDVIDASNSDTDDKGLLSHIGSAFKSIETDAAKTYAAVFAWAAPELGPFAAIPAAAATALVIGAEVLIPSLAVGTSNVPVDTIAQLHAGEIVMPKYDADMLRNFTNMVPRNLGTVPTIDFGDFAGVAGGSRGGLAAGGGGQNIHVEQHNTFNNPQSEIMRMMKKRKLVRQMATDVGRHMTMNPSTRGSY